MLCAAHGKLDLETHRTLYLQRRQFRGTQAGPGSLPAAINCSHLFVLCSPLCCCSRTKVKMRKLGILVRQGAVQSPVYYSALWGFISFSTEEIQEFWKENPRLLYPAQQTSIFGW